MVRDWIGRGGIFQSADMFHGNLMNSGYNSMSFEAIISRFTDYLLSIECVSSIKQTLSDSILTKWSNCIPAS
jgi:hypothetical protein